MNNRASKVKSPCVKICKYDDAFLNGMVCIGCFREQFEITNWIKMSENEKKKIDIRYLGKEKVIL